MLKKINYSDLNFDLFEETYINILKKSNEEILTILEEMQEFEDKNKIQPFFKPDWNPYLIRSFNYVGNSFVINKV
jgi:hypothetical protein